MISEAHRQEYYQALLDKNPDYEGVFYVGITSTGVFCRPTCPARKPKLENCEFYHTAQEALLASFRPCKRCKPLSHPNATSSLINELVQLVEEHPEKRWRESDLRAMNIDASTARRHFKERFGMSFIEYARARRLGIAMKMIHKGGKVIDAQLSADFESSSGFGALFPRLWIVRQEAQRD